MGEQNTSLFNGEMQLRLIIVGSEHPRPFGGQHIDTAQPQAVRDRRWNMHSSM